MAWAKPVCGPATSTPSLNPNSTDLCSVGEASALVEDAWE